MLKPKSPKKIVKTKEPEPSYNEAYAQGYFDCLSHYGVVSKLQRTNIKRQISQKGPGYIRRRGGGVPVL